MKQWKSKKLGEIATFAKGKGISKNEVVDNGQTECIRYGELYTFYGEVISEIKSKTNTDISSLVLSEANDVIIPASGETQIDIATASCVIKSGVALGGDLNIIRTRNNGVFLSYYLNSKKKLEIAKLSQGISVVHLYSSQLALLNIKLPQLEEQEKLASFLSLLNSRIQTQKKIIEDITTLKIQSRNKLFTQIIKGDYEVFTIEEILSYEQPTKYIVSSTDYSSNKSLIPVLTANKAFILGYTNEDWGIYNKGKCIILDDFTMDLKYVDFPFKVKSSAIKLLTSKNNVDLKFIFEYFSFLNLSSNEHKRHYISELQPMLLNVPPIAIQNNLSNFLSKLDEKINLETTLLTQYENQKKYLLQNLFI
ncbi:restriction endonuclease subunit S [Chryseobacterium gleum]|uniref:restriction endonuclease subunit S n=1 Tax=Chryseobacterium gleum TaxID=250 RepID=UPI001E541D59|nr:restriction endonuclease subunit S [Chryseobacterium gleum]MCD9616893.1 restriction endonuclease subunit S [Chryseobacterium gleum]